MTTAIQPTKLLEKEPIEVVMSEEAMDRGLIEDISRREDVQHERDLAAAEREFREKYGEELALYALAYAKFLRADITGSIQMGERTMTVVEIIAGLVEAKYRALLVHSGSEKEAKSWEADYLFDFHKVASLYR